jgi:transposase
VVAAQVCRAAQRDQVICGVQPVILDGAQEQGGLRCSPYRDRGMLALTRHQLATEFVADLRRLDAQLRDTRKKLGAAVTASGTSVTDVFGIGPVNAGIIIGDVTDVTRFATRDHFAAYNGTAPVEVSSGNRKTYRLSLHSNRRLNHAIHIAAITQIRHAHSDGRAYYDKKITEGKTPKEALRALKRRISNAIYARLRADARKAAATARSKSPGGQTGNDTDSSAAGSHPARQLFGQATPGPETTLRPVRQPGSHSARQATRRQPRSTHGVTTT